MYLALTRRVGGILITYDRGLPNKCGDTAMKASPLLKTLQIR